MTYGAIEMTAVIIIIIISLCLSRPEATDPVLWTWR